MARAAVAPVAHSTSHVDSGNLGWLNYMGGWTRQQTKLCSQPAMNSMAWEFWMRGIVYGLAALLSSGYSRR